MKNVSSVIAWTPCDEELPDDDTVVLVAIDGGSDPVWFGSHNSESERWYSPDQTEICWPVTHWAELPEGP